MINSENERIFSESFPFWNELSSDEKKLINSNTELKLYKAGTTIHDSTECTGVLLIKKGELRVYILSPEGREVTLYRLGKKGDMSFNCLMYFKEYYIQYNGRCRSR